MTRAEDLKKIEPRNRSGLADTPRHASSTPERHSEPFSSAD
jgi:hypothetical protein